MSTEHLDRELDRDLKVPLEIVAAVDQAIAAIVPADPANPWSFMDAGEAYAFVAHDTTNLKRRMRVFLRFTSHAKAAALHFYGEDLTLALLGSGDRRVSLETRRSLLRQDEAVALAFSIARYSPYVAKSLTGIFGAILTERAIQEATKGG